MTLAKRATIVVGTLVLAFAATVYFTTLCPTVPFWDAGEFIAVSYILGVPHPPGTPFYVLLGRVATLIPLGSVAQRVNALSAVAAVFTVLLTYLTGLRLIRIAQGGQRSDADEWIAQVGAVIGALLLAFSDNFWENSIEAEVYGMMSLAQILVFWLGLKWWEDHERRPTVGPLLLCVYVMWLCVGLHLGVGMMGVPLMVLAFLVDRRVALLFAMPFVTVLLVNSGLERMAGGVLAFATVLNLIFAARKQLNVWVALAAGAVSVYGMYVGFSDAHFTMRSGLLVAASVVLPFALLARGRREGRILALALFLMVAGYSTHAYLPIRAAEHPAINEGDPSNWNNLSDLLERKQYGQMNMFVRKAPLAVQLNKEFWRYFSRQWPLFPHPNPALAAALPLVLGLLGAVWQGRRERVSFLTTLSLFMFATAGLILFLNFSDHEVRDRDYFFTTAYHVYSVWMGMGVVWLISWVRDSFAPGGARRWATVAAAVLLGAQPLLLMKHLWFTHDERGNYVAHDYAYNMLVPLADSSFVFTNGDNDTFPLWYIQQVEGVRKDVRVVNLSLLNTGWYIRQLRDQEPRVPISLDDRAVDYLGGGAVQDSSGRIFYTNEYMVGHIIQTDRTVTGWQKQPYFAVTVPEHMGLDSHFTLEGLVYKVNPDTLQPSIDEAAIRKAMYQTFRYRGLFNPDGSWDTRVYKDENASTLTKNYAAAHLQLALYYRRQGQLDRGITEMERVARMFPDYADVLLPLGGLYLEKGDTTKAEELFQRLVVRDAGNPEAHYSYGLLRLIRRDLPTALREFDAAIRLNPNYSLAYYQAYAALWEAGERERALAYLERWVTEHPGDTNASELLRAQRGQVGQSPLRQALPPPPPRRDLP